MGLLLKVPHIRLNAVNILDPLQSARARDGVEDSQDLLVLILQVLDLELQLLVLPFEFFEVFALFDILENSSELVNELVDVLNESLSDSHQTSSDILLPLLHNDGVVKVGPHSLSY